MSTRTLEITHVACMAFLLDSTALECHVLWAGTLFVLCTVCLVCTRTTPAPRTTFGTDDAGKQLARTFQAPDPALRLTFQPMFEAVLHHYKELLQGGMVCIQAAAQAQGGLEQDLDAEFHHVHQVDTLLHHLALGSWRTEAGTASLVD